MEDWADFVTLTKPQIRNCVDGNLPPLMFAISTDDESYLT